MITPEQLVALSNFLNASADLPFAIQEIADALKSQISPVVDSSPAEENVEAPAPEEASVPAEEISTPSEEEVSAPEETPAE